jgi:hypothetical protein
MHERGTVASGLKAPVKGQAGLALERVLYVV